MSLEYSNAHDKSKSAKTSEGFLNASLVVHSSDLFGDGNLVMIRHGEEWYRLMKTKQGKLILTK